MQTVIHPISFATLLLLVFGMGAESFGQVPQHPDRIRKTTKEVLSRPEFRLFPRLKSGQQASGLSSPRSGQGLPRMQSSRGFPPEFGDGPGEDRPGGQNQGQRLSNTPRQRGPNGLPLDAPDGNRPGANNPRNLDELLGRDDDFPEAGNLDGLLENRENPPRRDELNQDNELADNNPPENGLDHLFPDQNPHPAPQPPAGDPPPDRIENPPGNRPAQDNNQLPAPRPRDRADQEAESIAALPKLQVGALARFVGAVFHLMAWTILAVICGLIFWLIIKAIREYERPLRFAAGNADGGQLLDLEPAQAPGDLPADVYVRQAQQLAEQGRFREAVVQLVLGAMSRAERAGWVRFRRGMTVRDYLRDVQQYPAAYQGFRSIVHVFEPLTFGRRKPTREHFDQSLQGYETGFGQD